MRRSYPRTMGSSRNAFGVFSHSRERVDETFGGGSQYTEGLLIFWKDRYFVSILASPETEESKRAIFEAARFIDGVIPGEGEPPPILRLLPREKLAEETVRYFRNHTWLNSHHYISDENILYINEETEAVLAKYGAKGRRSILLIVDYGTAGDAEAAHRNFATQYLPELAAEPLVPVGEGSWTGCRLLGEVLAVVFNASTKVEAEKLLGHVEKRIASRERR